MPAFVFFSLLRGCVLLLPLAAAQRAGRALGLLAYHVLSKRRAIAMENVRRAWPEMGVAEADRIVRGAFENFGITTCEFLWLPRLTDERLRRLVRLPGGDSMLDPIRNGGPVVILSGHYGNWELAAAGIPRLSGRSCAVIVRTQSNARVDRAVTGLRTHFGNTVIPMEKSARETLRVLADGGMVAMLADQSAAAESEYVEFFGRRTATYRGPALLALRGKARVMMGFLVRRPDYAYDFELFEVQTADLAAAGDADVAELTRRHTALLETMIRKHPGQWLWTHRRWKHVR